MLLFNEWRLLMTPHIKKNTTVSTDPDKHAKIRLNMDLKFPNAPCFLLHVEAATSVNRMDHEETSKKLIWSHVNKDGDTVQLNFDSIDLKDEETTPGLIKKFFDDGLQCRVTGTVEMSKVTGQLIFRMQDHEKAPKKFVRDNKGQGYKLQMNHVVDSMTFGHQSQHEDIRTFFGDIDNGTHTIFNMFKKDGKVNEALKNEPEDKA